MYLQKTKHIKSYCALLTTTEPKLARCTNNCSDAPEQSPIARFNKY